MKILAKLLFVIFIASIATSSFAAKKASCNPNDNAIKLIKDMVKHPNLAAAIKKNVDLAEVWADLEDSGEADLNNDENVLDLLINVPRIKETGGFRPWFDIK